MDPASDHDAAPRRAALGGATTGASRSRCGPDDHTLTALYRVHYQPLVRQAALLVGEAAAEDVVQDSFLAVHGAWWRLRDTDKAGYYLQRSVINRSRSVLRHRAVARRIPPVAAPDMPSAEDGALALCERTLVAAALGMLSPRQREALVLRYYADLPEAQIAAAMGISTGTVKVHLSRAMASLRSVLAAETAAAAIQPESHLGTRSASSPAVEPALPTLPASIPMPARGGREVRRPRRTSPQSPRGRAAGDGTKSLRLSPE